MLIAIAIILLTLLLVAVAYVFLTMPRATLAPDMELVSTDYAHRGLWDEEYPENSLPAFRAAAEHGYGIEIDVHLSSDGQVMVFHDDSLLRMCGVKRSVSSVTAAELKTLRLKGSAYTIPTLREVLDTVGGAVPLLIEVKGKKREDALCEKMSELLDGYDGAFCVQSFNPIILSWFKGHRPRYARGQLVGDMKHQAKELGALKAFILTNQLANVISRPDFVSVVGTNMHKLSFVLATKVFRARGFVWTVRNEKSYRDVRYHGYFAIFEKIRP